MLKTIEVSTNSRNEIIDLSGQVKRLVAESGVQEGICVVASSHTTAAVTINENADPSVPLDISAYLEKLVPAAGYPFRHSEGNSDSHIKVSLVGPSVSLIISGGRLLLGTWQGIFFCEFDGPRRRKVWVKILAG